MSFSDDWLKNGLPVFSDAKGRTIARKMIDNLGGPTGFKTSKRTDIDGSVTTVQLKGDMPPQIRTVRSAVSDVALALRGFIARLSGRTFGLMFWPVDMLKRKDPFRPVAFGYYVVPFATSHNAAAAETSYWNDVAILTDSGKLLINNMAYSGFGMVASVVGVAGRIPYVIPKATADYGALADNSGQVKRIFAVGRDAVTALTDGSVAAPEVVLSPVTPRDERKAVVCGQAIASETNTATLSEFWFTGASWDSISGGWVISSNAVSMLLTDPYLSSVRTDVVVEQSYVVPSSNGPSAQNAVVPEGFPEVEMWVVGVGELGSHSGLNANVDFPFRRAEKRSVSGTRTITGSREVWTGSYSHSSSVAGVPVMVSYENTLETAVLHDTLGHAAFEFDLPPASNVSIESDTGTYSVYWQTTTWTGDDLAQFDVNTVPRGLNGYGHEAAALFGSATYATRDQSGSFSVSLETHDLVLGEFSQSAVSGSAIAAVAVENRYASALSNPYGWLGASHGFGATCRIRLNITSGGYVDESVLEPIVLDRANVYIGGECYDRWPGDYNTSLYTSSITERTPVDNRSLQITTRDFIFYDKNESVYIYVLGNITVSGPANTTASVHLTVSIVVESRLGTAVEPIYVDVLSLPYALPLEPLTESVDYIPLPKLGVFFTPNYREQGAFSGVTYTTLSEELAGASPCCLANFIFGLRSYDAVGEDDPDGYVRVIPCNLIEMLYAYVFSGKYGIDADQRYPIEYALNYNTLMRYVFSERRFRVSYKNGVFIDWLDTFGGSYASEQTQELYRI